MATSVTSGSRCLAQEVDPDQDIEHAETQVAQDRDALERVDLAVEVLDPTLEPLR